MFADDTIVSGKVVTTADCDILQRDLHQVVQCSVKWQMPLSFEKCEVMHAGSRNCNLIYNMGGRGLYKEESDLAITIRCEKSSKALQVCQQGS